MIAFFTKRMWLLTMLLVFFVQLQQAKSQSTSGWKQMVAGLSSYDSHNIENLIPSILTVPGISYQGYCATSNCILLLFDPAIYTEEQQITDAFTFRKLKIFPKSNTTFKMITDECDLSLPQTVSKN